MAVHVVNGDPSWLRELAVDAADQVLQIGSQILVARNILPAGDDHLHQRDLPAKLRIAAQQDAKRFQPLGNSLGVVQTVEPEHQDVFVQVTAEACNPAGNFRTRRILRELVEPRPRRRWELRDLLLNGRVRRSTKPC